MDAALLSPRTQSPCLVTSAAIRHHPSPPAPSDRYRARIGPLCEGRNNKIIPTLTIILPTSTTFVRFRVLPPFKPHLCLRIFFRSLTCPPPLPPPHNEEIATLGDTDWLSRLDQCLRTLVTNTSRACLGLSNSETGRRTIFAITTSAAFTSLSAI